MLDFKSYQEINSKAIKSIKTDSDGDTISDCFNTLVFYFLFYALPLLFSILIFVYDVKISSFDKVTATGVAIFTGLFFSLLLNISSRIRIEKDNPNIDNKAFERYKNNMKQIANITLYIISLGIYILSLLLINHILKDALSKYVEISLTAIIFFMIIRYLISILFMIQRFRFIIRDEIENIL
ncbi:hypothetical protein [uncultured Tenacibaculum sp.]|uniref:hypothetical protein n=1 Tax=uncultured Tenacibaculum sp. TaxID=174713 RepID=UPI002605E68F|nr:hypothetical protein [uncultured Tenacibaculum sp.]